MFKSDELLRVAKGRLINAKRDIEIRGICINSRILKSKEAFVAIRGNKFDGHDFIPEAIKKGASCIVKESRDKRNNAAGIPVMEVADTQKALADFARLWRSKFNIPVVAVTGSNGKTTTKEMLAWVLSAKHRVLKNEGTKNNHIGLPMALLGLRPGHELAILEIGTNHPGEARYLAEICQANIGLITNIGPAHIQYFKNLAGVFREKYALIENLKKPRIGILNADDKFLRKELAAKKGGAFTIGFGLKEKTDYYGARIKSCGQQIEFLVNAKHRFTLNTAGVHNIYNALAAIAVSRLFAMDYGEIASRLTGFEFPSGRLKVVQRDKISFIDDTYNSNPLSLKQALEALDRFKTPGRKIFIMGDMLELGKDTGAFHRQAGRQAFRVCDVFITVGEFSKLSAQVAKGCGFNTKNLFTCDSSLQARQLLFQKLDLKDNDVVLVKGSRLMKMEEVFKDF